MLSDHRFRTSCRRANDGPARSIRTTRLRNTVRAAGFIAACFIRSQRRLSTGVFVSGRGRRTTQCTGRSTSPNKVDTHTSNDEGDPMRGVKHCQVSTGRIKKHRYSNEFKVTAVKMATAPDIETKAVAETLNIRPFILSRWKKEHREGKLKGLVHPKLKEQKAMEGTVTEAARVSSRCSINRLLTEGVQRLLKTYHEEVQVMKVQRIVFVAMLMVGLMVISAPIAPAAEVMYDLKPAATMKALLTDSIGKRVVLRLESSEEIEGTVSVVGEHLVHISKLSKRDFFDAFISIDRVSAVIIRAR